MLRGVFSPSSMSKSKQQLKEWFAEEYMYWVQGIEVGTRTEKRMEKFQKKVERMMKRRRITLIAYKGKDEGISLSYVPEKEWNEQKDRVDKLIAEEAVAGVGDPLVTPKSLVADGIQKLNGNGRVSKKKE